MDKNLQILEAAMAKLRAEALEELAIVDLVLSAPASMGEEGHVDKVIKHVKAAMIAENSMNALQMYFVPQQEQAAPAPPAPPEPEPAPEPAKVKRTRKKS